MAKLPSSYDILKNRDFRLLISGRFCLTMALQIQSVVVGWQVYEITKNPLYLGFIGLAEAVPAISLALVGGHVVDRGQPLKIYRTAILVGIVGMIALFIAGGGFLPLTSDAKLAVIFSTIFLLGIVRAFAWPAIFALVPQIVERAQFAVAQTWQSATFQVAAVSGPAIGGMVYAWAGPRAAYAISLLLAFFTVAATFVLKVGHVDRSSAGKPREPLVESLASGARFVFSNQVILGALSLDMFAVLFGGATALLPIFAGEILLSGPQSLGILRAAPAIGALCMSFVMIHRPLGRAAGALLLWAVAAYGVCIIGFGLSKSLWLSVVLLGLSGAFDAISVVIRHTILQLWTPDDMRGRVSAVNMIFIGSSNEIGEFESGLAARFLGTVPSVVFGGVMTMIVVVGAAVFAPKLRKIELAQPIQKS